MATATVALHSARVWTRIFSLLCQAATQSYSSRAGRSNVRTKKRRVWVCAGTPTGTAPAGMKAGDFILDTTNNKVYNWISSTTYTELSATT